MLVIGVALAALSFVAVLAFGGLGQKAPNPPQSVEVAVMVAATDLQLGAQITADNLTTETRAEADAVDTFQYPEDVVGKIVRHAVAQGDALTTSDFETSVNVPELVSSLQPGLRAIAVPLSRVDAVGALVQAGDFVDVMLTMEDTDALNPIVIDNPNASNAGLDGTSEAPYLSIDEFINNTTIKVVVQNVQVVASIEAVVDPQSNNASTQYPAPEVVVLLAVTPQQAEVVRFAQLDGNISLVLRAPGDSSAADVTDDRHHPQGAGRPVRSPATRSGQALILVLQGT